MLCLTAPGVHCQCGPKVGKPCHCRGEKLRVVEAVNDVIQFIPRKLEPISISHWGMIDIPHPPMIVASAELARYLRDYEWQKHNAIIPMVVA